MTKAELADHILKQLGVLGAGQTATAEDRELMETIIDNCQGELEQLNVALWPVDDIPGYAIESFCLYCKSSTTAFGMQYDEANRTLAEKRLRKLTADPRHTVGKADYF